MFRPNYLEASLFEDKKTFADLLISDIDGEIEILYKTIAATKEKIATLTIQVEALKPFLQEPLAYKRKQTDLAKKAMRKSKSIKQKNIGLLKLVDEKIEVISSKFQKDLFVKVVGSQGHHMYINLLQHYRSNLIDRNKELDKNIVTYQKDIENFSKFDEAKQLDDINNKIIIQNKILEKEHEIVKEHRNHIKQLTALQNFLKNSP